VEKVALGQLLLQALRFFPVSVFPPKLRIHLHLRVHLHFGQMEGQMGEALKTSKKQRSYGNRGKLARKVIVHSIHRVKNVS
jgi:hypothetical protein